MRRLHSVSKIFLYAVVSLITVYACAQTPAQSQNPLSSVLDPNGSIRRDVAGTFDPDGFRMTEGPNGEPRFVPKNQVSVGQTGCSDGWDSNFHINGTDGLIKAVVSDGLGNVYVGGSFRIVQTVLANSIAKWDGTSWSALGTGITDAGGIWSIAVSGTDVYVAGDFSSAGGVPANNVAKWNGTSWSALGAGMGSSGSHRLHAIAVSGSDVYVGGRFSSSGGFPNYVAQWNGSTWSSMGTGMNQWVNSLAVLGGTLYAGGRFTDAGGTPATGIAQWNGTSWSAVDTGVDNQVLAFAVSGTDLYVGGAFATAGGTPASNVAKWDGTTWTALGSGVDGAVLSLAVSGPDVYVGGDFAAAGALAANRTAKWNGSSWSAMETGIDGLGEDVNGIAVLGDTVFAGGNFLTAGGNYAQSLATWSDDTWSAFEGTSVDWNVRSVAVSGTDVYVAGNFDYAGPVRVDNVAKWDGTSWSALGSGIPGGFLNVITVSGNDVYVGGNFSNAGGVSARNIARWNGTNWSQLGSGVSGGVVLTITVVNSDVYAGGSFTSAGGVPANHIAKWDGASWSGLDSAIVNSVTAIVPFEDFLYVGAATNSVDSPNYFLKYDGTTWIPLGQGMTGGGVRSIAVIGTDVFVAGLFNGVGGISAARIAKYDGTSWTALGSGLPGNSNQVQLAAVGTDLYAVGDFSIANGGPGNGAAKWNGISWSPLGEGLGGFVGATGNSVEASGDGVYVGGFFTTAGCNLSPYFARWRQTEWTGSFSTDWHDPANWGSGAIPTSSQGVTIEASDASITSADVTVSSLIVTGGRTLSIGVGRTLTVTDDLYLENGNLAGPGNLIVNGDLTLDGAGVTGFGSITVDGNLYLNGGNISGTGSVLVTTCQAGAISGEGGDSFVAAPLTRCVNAAGTYRFPVGTGAVYSPLEMENIVGSANFTVAPKSGAYSGSPAGLPANRLLRWWNLTNGGITQADVSFYYSDSEVVGSESRYRVYRIDGGTATRIPSSLDQMANKATVNGVTAFSPWTLAESASTLETLAGRVTTLRGRGAESVIVSLTDGQGMTRYAVTNPFGYFKFYDVATFQIYQVRVTSKKFTFDMPVQSVDFDELTGDVNFVSTDN